MGKHYRLKDQTIFDVPFPELDGDGCLSTGCTCNIPTCIAPHQGDRYAWRTPEERDEARYQWESSTWGLLD